MSVYKEGFYAVDMLKRASQQVYPDAADFGVKTKKGDRTWNLAKQLVDFYAVEGTRKVERYLTGVSVETTVELMDEWNPPHKRTRFRVSYCSASDLKQFDGYISIEEVK